MRRRGLESELDGSAAFHGGEGWNIKTDLWR